MAPAPLPAMPLRERPLLVGYYGEHNLGDDALLEVLLASLPPGCRPVVTARDQALVRQRFGVACVDRTDLGAVMAALGGCDALVFGGGSLLQDSTSFLSLVYYGCLVLLARSLGKPVLLWGQGLGPLRRRRSRWLVRGLLPAITTVSWRDATSASLARRLGARAEPLVGADPVWSVAPEPWHGMGGPLVLCFRPTVHLKGEAWRPWLAALELLAPERDVIWLPFHAVEDRGLLASLLSQGLLGSGLAARSRELCCDHPREAMAVCAGAGLVLAMRLHGLILAAAAGAPVAALSYDPKVSAAALSLDCPLAELNRPVDAAALLIQWRQSLDRPPNDQRIQALRRSTAVHRRVLEGAFGPPAG
ncbi:polysaccharide pyruvyl transferase CsaB [Cyanobium sp. NS01]|uniref:polysaccharide pyruvyl transferase CsaB n=1 Tax=Cyanobium sp. NS01 TaxID=261284 RepID=UPI001862F5ED|nr:polysaccharide pyruvyl transferase CsaB [Cyanobium sp. NS01]QNI70337.1 polysaccharide pyruvyl transferase [Cyanobium sp. NS01]